MDFYTLPVDVNWLKAKLKIIIGNRDLSEIMQFGDLWTARGHTPLVHVVSPAMDGGKMWDQHEDPSGLLDNIPEHIDLFIVDFNNRSTPELPKTWDEMKAPPKWLLWEFESGKVKFNGTYQQFVAKFGVDPATSAPIPPPTGSGNPDTPTPTAGGIFVHLQCPHCGRLIY